MEEEFYISESEVTLSMKMVRFYFQRIGWVAPNYTAKLFWKLFTNPRSRPFNPSHKVFLSKAESSTHRSIKNKAEFTIHKFGKGERVVLICHGWEGRTTDFKDLVEVLSKEENIQVWSIDFPGHGTSVEGEAHLPLFIDVLNSVLLMSPNIETLVGHSMGAACIAMSVPENPSFFIEKKIVLMGLHPEPSQFFDQYRKVTRISDRLYKRCVTYAENKVAGSLMDYDCHKHVELYDKNKVFFIHDLKDRIIKPVRIERLSQQIPSATSFFGDNGGHFKHFRHTDVVREISTFVKNK
jgi:pimeloyl-ACP methyl ester carboxylesterase